LQADQNPTARLLPERRERSGCKPVTAGLYALRYFKNLQTSRMLAAPRVRIVESFDFIITQSGRTRKRLSLILTLNDFISDVNTAF
jgi:hypothetical protein